MEVLAASTLFLWFEGEAAWYVRSCQVGRIGDGIGTTVQAVEEKFSGVTGKFRVSLISGDLRINSIFVSMSGSEVVLC